jgi:hypothetical protein
VRPAEPDETLRKAEQRYLADKAELPIEREKDDEYKKLLEDSRYQD